MSKLALNLSSQEEIDLNSSEDCEEILREIAFNEASPFPKSSLILTIQTELASLKHQLTQINEKISKNQETVSSKQKQNTEMRTLLSNYNDQKDEFISANTACSCTQSCLIY
jgi:septation ring formation regulator EzrA